ncbi:twin-arginine translocase TatA/TatE family subunit [Dethiobacter alkaliphilus]|uniref:twin-arginine translocase TatA/TatE family subunit n=1 Tax=Dethiobacter alkaliphilus TaxID=427926 RepID=UPI0022269E63|nr:twin-arginine translocase TatA/TatE family subunit [Dethiobacter alkaliphilus]MCW3488520.1 twin-arginine translocase TatA/TatE family subunit [Dethiobacter alkaliphilus]
MLGKIGLSELLLAGGLILLIFGPKKLPEIGRSFGKGLQEFKQATKELTDSVQLDEETNE